MSPFPGCVIHNQKHAIFNSSTEVPLHHKLHIVMQFEKFDLLKGICVYPLHAWCNLVSYLGFILLILNFSLRGFILFFCCCQVMLFILLLVLCMPLCYVFPVYFFLWVLRKTSDILLLSNLAELLFISFNILSVFFLVSDVSAANTVTTFLFFLS